MEFGFPENMTVDSKVGTCFMRYPENPMAERLHFAQNWEFITTDQWVLSIIKEGCNLDFIRKYVWTGIKKTVIAHKDLDIFMGEVKCLTEKNAIEKVDYP